MGYYDHKIGEANAGGLKAFRDSPLEYIHYIQGAKKATRAMSEGRVFHLALQEPEEFARTCRVMPEMPLRSKDDKTAFLATCGVDGDPSQKADDLRDHVSQVWALTGVVSVSEQWLATMRAMCDSLNMPQHAEQRTLVVRGKKELELYWADRETGIQCKARVDSWDEETGIVSDLKRTESIGEWEFRRELRNRGYIYQGAWYMRALRESGYDPRTFAFCCASPVAPHCWASYECDPADLRIADDRHQETLRRLRDCLEANSWQSRNDGETRIISLEGKF